MLSLFTTPMERVMVHQNKSGITAKQVEQRFCYGLQTPAESGKDCGEDHQDSTALSAEHLPPQSPQESCLHPKRTRPTPSTLLPSGWRYRSVKSKTTRLKNSFFPMATDS